MTEHTVETLKELIEARLKASEKAVDLLAVDLTQKLLSLKELMEQRFQSYAKVVDLLTVEVSRRLLDLNNSHAVAVQKEQTFVGRIENTTERNAMAAKIDALTKTQNMMVGGLFLLQILMAGLLYFMRGPV